MIEHCRDCRDMLPFGARLPVAEFILWGKLFPPEALGPKCAEHARAWFDISEVEMGGFAVYDLRPVYELLALEDPWR